MSNPRPGSSHPLAARVLVAFVLLLATAPSPAQEEKPKRPRIGLVLSGGGARGSAHVGVLQVLEELRVPVDVVVGTSMGSIVGGLYAYGLSPAELKTHLVREGMANDWPYLLSDGARRQDLVFRRKEDERRFLTDLRVGVHDGALAFPKGLLQGQNLETELRCLTMAAHDLRSFDDLPLPFRCVAVDINTGEQVVLDHGSLPEAMRASMSLPGIFAPARIDGRELLDGGLLNNVPVDVARKLGADVLIVVDIGTPLEMDAEIKDLFSVTGQMVAILTDQNVRQSRASLKPSDILITPDLGTITSADFERGAESIAIGESAARGFADRLRQFAVPEAEYAAFLQRQRRAPAPLPRLGSLQIANDSGLGNDLIEARLGLRIGEPLDEAALRAGLERLYGTDDLERVAFSLQGGGDPAELHVRVEEKEWGPSYMRFGLSLESNYQGESVFNLSAQYNARLMDSLGSELRTRVQVGRDNLVESEYYKPFDVEGVWFVAPRVSGVTQPVNYYQQGQKVAEIDATYGTLGIDVGAQLGHWGEMRVGLEGALGNLDPDLSTIPLSREDFQDVVARVLLRADTLDNPVFPHTGSLAAAEWRAGLEALGADQGYQRLEVDLLQAIPLGASTALVPTIRITTALDDTLPIYTTPGIGGFLQLSGYARDTFRDQHTGLFALIAHHRVSGRNSPFSLPLHIGGSVEAGNAWSTRSDFLDSYRVAGSAFVGMDTPLGPCFLAYGQAEGGERSVYFFLGPWF